jgi:phage tail sheath protein FI
MSFFGGSDGADEATLSIGSISLAYDKFKSPEDVDVSFLITGKARGGSHGEQLPNYIIDNVADVRKDCIVFVSPDRADVVNNIGSEATDIVEFRNALTASSYGFLDSGYKYQYDKYNDVYRYIPLNGDIAGLAVRSDNERDPWYSPAGFTRGVIKNVVKLAYNPKQADRDILYKADINPVVAFPGQGIILFGDKTLLGRPSAFDRINVRRLFIVLEKAIAIAARSYLFEFNDEFTRAQFKGLVDPFLADIQGRRGITDYRVVCDSTNNTAEVIDRNEFVGDIYIKPAKSINYIQLNCVAVRSGVEFNEIVGRF